MAGSPQAPAIQQDFSLPRIYAWLKGVESKVNTLLREVDLLKNDFLKKVSAQKQDLSALNDEVLDLKHTQDRLSQKVDLVINELKRTAGKEELLTLQKYIDLWNPLHFATQRDVEKIVEEKLAERKHMTHSTHSSFSAASSASHAAPQHTASQPHPHHASSYHAAAHETHHASTHIPAHPVHHSAYSVHHLPLVHHATHSTRPTHKAQKKPAVKAKKSKKHK